MSVSSSQSEPISSPASGSMEAPMEFLPSDDWVEAITKELLQEVTSPESAGPAGSPIGSIDPHMFEASLDSAGSAHQEDSSDDKEISARPGYQRDAYPCKVCGRKDNGHRSAYGGKACPSCRAFFRRAVQAGKTSEAYSCKSGLCKIDSRSWKSCPGCRFKRCVELAGMQEELVLFGTDISRKRRKKSLMVKTEVEEVEEQPTSSITMLKEPDERFTFDESILLQGLYVFAIEKMIDVILREGVKREGFSDQLVNCMVTGEKKRKEDIIFFTRFFNENGKEVSRLSSDLEALDLIDQDELTRKNGPLIVQTFYASGYDNMEARENFIKTVMSKNEPHYQNIQRIFRSFGIDLNHMNLLKPSGFDDAYQQDYYPDPKLFRRHREVVLTLQSLTLKDPYASAKDVDRVQIMLLVLIILFSSKGLELKKSRQRADDIQRKYARMLFKYLKYKYEDSVLTEHRFSQLMSARDLAWEAKELSEKVS